MGTLRIGNDVVVPLLVQENGGEADISGNIVLMPNLCVPKLSFGVCTSKDYFNFSNAYVINVVCKNILATNIYNAGDILNLKKDDNNFFRITVNGYSIRVQLKLNNVFEKDISYSNSTPEWSALNSAYDYIVVFDYANKKAIIKTRTMYGVYNNSIDLDLSDWGLDSLNDFQIITELGGSYSATAGSKFVVLNQYLNIKEYLDEPLLAENYSPFSASVDSNQVETGGLVMIVGGTRVQTISPTHVINSFNLSSLEYFAMGHYSSNIKTNGNLMVTKIRFTEITSEVGIVVVAGGGGDPSYSYILDEDYNLIWTGSSTSRFIPEVNKWYIFQTAGSKDRIPSYTASYSYKLVGAGTVEVKAIANSFARKNNIGSINWNGKYFTGNIPFLGEKINFAHQSTFSMVEKIPLYQTKIENGNIYMWNGSVWKQLSS